MTSLYAQYLKERTSDEIIECDTGFITYRKIDEKIMYVPDIFVLSEVRNHGIARNLLDKVSEYAKSIGCTQLIGTVLSNKIWTTLNLKMMFNYGFEVTSSTNEAIVLKKDI
jgi:GNAT superfamily N-acetyltransferase